MKRQCCERSKQAMNSVAERRPISTCGSVVSVTSTSPLQSKHRSVTSSRRTSRTVKPPPPAGLRDELLDIRHAASRSVTQRDVAQTHVTQRHASPNTASTNYCVYSTRHAVTLITLTSTASARHKHTRTRGKNRNKDGRREDERNRGKGRKMRGDGREGKGTGKETGRKGRRKRKGKK